MCSFIEDDRGATEPYTDLPALGIVAVGLVIFAFLLFSAYSSYASTAYYTAVRGDLRSLARAIACDPAFCDGTGLLDARKLDNAAENVLDLGAPVQVAVEAPGYRWLLGRPSRGTSASYVLPVAVKLNDARCVPGTMTVTMWER